MQNLCFAQSKTIKEIKIGPQTWMTENLNVDRFRNGDLIPEVKSNEEWQRAGELGQPAWCYYENNPANGAKYGRLYNWYAVNDARGLAPVGWHVPNIEEWKQLVDYLGGENAAGEKMKSNNGWKESGNGSNSSGFSAYPGGYRDFFGAFRFLGESANWWNSWEYDTGKAWILELYYLKTGMSFNVYELLTPIRHEGYGISVRCLRD
jgi:uncharacterized protein (TIGR02145 family)